MAGITRHFGGWPLEDIYALYGREVLAEAQRNPELADRLAEEIRDIENALDTYRIRRRSAGGYAYLRGYANGRLQVMHESDAEPEASEHYWYDPGAESLAAVCLVAIDWRLLAV